MAAPPPARKRPARRGAPDPGQRALLGFGARFLAVWIVGLVLLTQLPGIEGAAIDATVAHLVAFGRLLGQSARSVATSVFMAGQSVQIVSDCTPLLSTLALWSAVVAYPAPWRARLLGVVAGAFALWIFNLLRILALFPILIFRPQWFDFVHVYLWQTVTVLAVIGLFILWLRVQSPRASAA